MVKEDPLLKQGVLEVTKSQLVAAALACLVVVSLAVSPASAQTAPRPSIALLDVNYIFKNHTRFNAMRADLTAEVERAEQQLKSQRDELQKQQDALKDFKPGSVEYKQREQDLARRVADLNIRMQAQRKEFLLKEAGIYNTVYKEIQQVVAYYANQQGFTAVVKFNGDPAQEDDPDTVLRTINQDVVWYAPGLDITPVILEQLNRRAVSSASGTNAPASNPSSRPGVPFPR